MRSLAAVNFFLGVVGIVQVTRILLNQSAQKTIAEAAVDIKDEVKAEAKDVKESVAKA